jgi:hypothetical protein
MTRKDAKEHMDTRETNPSRRSKDTHSGTPNPVDPNDTRNNEHQSGYGGEGGDAKSSSDERQRTNS